MQQSRHLVSHDRSVSIQRRSTSALYLDPLSSADPCTMAQAALGRLSGLANKARSTVEPSYRFAEKNITEQYKKTMQANKQYVVQDQAAADKLFKQWFFTKLSRIPKVAEASQKEWSELKGQWAKRSDLHLTEVGQQALFAAELYAWFCVGEVVGRGGSLAGYRI